MTIDNEVLALKSIPLFSSLEESQLKLLAFTSERLEFGKGDYLFKQGQAGHEAYILMEGEARATIKTPQGEKEIALLHPYDFIGEIAILCETPRSATIQAVTSVKVIKISKDLFFQLVREFPEIALNVMKALALRLQQMVQKHI